MKVATTATLFIGVILARSLVPRGRRLLVPTDGNGISIEAIQALTGNRCSTCTSQREQAGKRRFYGNECGLCELFRAGKLERPGYTNKPSEDNCTACKKTPADCIDENQGEYKHEDDDED